jgi:tetratricopeptide (TPR) repeat protein/CHAT domain-containing protein
MTKHRKTVSSLVFILFLLVAENSYAFPKDIQSIIDSAKSGYLTEEMHRQYWGYMNSLRKKTGSDERKIKTLSDWYPKINRLQLQYNREFIKSLKLTLKNKKITYSDGYESSYQRMKNEMFDSPWEKGTKEYGDYYRNAIPSFKQSKHGVDLMFRGAATGEIVTSPFDKDIQLKIDSQYVLAMEASIEEGWKNLLKLNNPNWGKSLAQSPNMKLAIETLEEGKYYEKGGQYEEAIVKYQLALNMFLGLKMFAGVSVSLQNIGMAYQSLGQYDNAVKKFLQSLSVFRKLKDESGVATVLNNIGSLYKSKDQYDKALEYCLQALAIERKLKKEDKIATLLNEIGYIYLLRGTYDKAIKNFQEALEINRKLGREKGITTGLNNIGSVYKSKGQYDKALEFYQEALAIDRKLEVATYISIDLNNVGSVYHSWAQYDKALEYYQKSLAIDREIGNEYGVATVLNNIGEVYRSWAQYDKALENYQKALAINQKLGKEYEVATVHNNIGMVYHAWARYDKVIEHYQQALEINQKLGRKSQSLVNLSNIGMVYHAWGQYDKSLEYFNKALIIARKLGDEEGLGAILNNIGLVYSLWEQYDNAMEYFQQALEISRKLGKENIIALSHMNIGAVFRAEDQYNKAAEHYLQSLVMLRKLGDESGIATVLNNIGSMYTILGKHDEALEFFQRALTIARKLRMEDKIALILSNFGGVYYLQEQYVSAIKYLVESIELTEKLRKTAVGAARRDYLASQIGTYKLLISIYLLTQEPVRAFEVMEQSRSRLLAERLGDNISDENVISAKSIQDEMKSSSAILSYSNSIWTEISLVTLTQSEIHGQEISVADTLKSILKKHKTAIQTMTGNQREIKVVKKDSGQLSLDMADEKSTLEKTINFYRMLLANPSLENDKALKEIARVLYDLLIKPMEAHFQGKNELVIIPDGILGYLPFETLVDEEGRYLVEKYVIRYAQSMTVQQLIKNFQYKSSRKPMLALGGAVYDEINYEAEMVTNEKELDFIKNKTFLAMMNERSMEDAYASLGISQISNLPGTLEEIKAISRIIKDSDVLSGKEVTEGNIKSMSDSGELAQYRVLHFATHGVTVPAFPELSAIVLSQFKEGQNNEDGYLRMGEIAKLKLNADFVNLSACETGLGKIYGGEGVVGLTQSFLIAGAKGLSVSLWKVSDKSTAMFMVGMYQLVEQKGMSYAQAINEMKRAFIKSQVSMDTFESSRDIQVTKTGEAKSGKLNHPYYWAPFVYYGLN